MTLVAREINEGVFVYIVQGDVASATVNEDNQVD